jgi:AraC-like DNA-binding protein
LFKYNSYIDSHHPELPFINPSPHYLPEDFTGLRAFVSEMTLLSLLVYVSLAVAEIWRAYRLSGHSLGSSQPPYLARLRNLATYMAVFPVLIVLIKPNYYHDLGDYMLACYITVTIYGTSLLVMSGSHFFRQEPMRPEPAEVAELPKKKYEKSSLSEEVEENLLLKLNRLLTDEQPYLDSDLTLPKLAQRLNTSPHHLSQLLNDRLQQSFFDLLAQYRVQEAQRLLHAPTTSNLKIDEIAERVGYNSTSAFHTAFKRLTGQTPAQFRASPSQPST